MKTYIKKKLNSLLAKPVSEENKGILIPKYSLGYKSIPKNACTSTKHALYKLQHGRNYQYQRDKQNKTKNHIHYHFSKEHLPCDISQAKHRIVILRDPVERFVSAYENRIIRHRELSEEKLKGNYQGKIGPDFIFDPNLDQFIEHFEEYKKARSINWHTLEQYKHTKVPLEFFTKIYTMQSLPELEEFLSSLAGKDLQLKRLQTSRKKSSIYDLSEEQLDFLIDYYKEDYAYLQDFYTPDKLWEKWKSKPAS